MLQVLFGVLLQVQQTPIPRDIPLPLPLPEWILITALIVSFLAHILFVNLMFGGTLLTLLFEIIGYTTGNKDYDRLSLEIAKTTTVNKSLAVVLGVAPLLTINTLYTLYFYSANALTGLMWIMIIPLVTIAFLLLYGHKYSYELLQHNKPLHIAILGLAAMLFLFIPLIFLTNVNLMLMPEKWSMVKGFLSALVLPNVWPRYFHFIFASLAVTGLFLFGYFSRQKYPFREVFCQITRNDLKKRFYSIAFFASIAQFLIGPIVLFTLPSKGLSWPMIGVIVTGACISIPALYIVWKELTGDERLLGKNFRWVAICLTTTVIFMGYGRHLYRATSLDPHQALVKKHTEEYLAQVKEAKEEALKPKVVDATKPVLSAGETVFEENCKACHAVNEKVVGPSFKEARQIYRDNKAGLVAWITKPGKKRDGPVMPPQSHLSSKQISDVADWILKLN